MLMRITGNVRHVHRSPFFAPFLTVVNTFSTLFQEKYFLRFIAKKLVTTQVGLPYSYYDETIAA